VGTTTQTPAQMNNPPGLAAIGYRAGTYSQFLASMRARLSSPAYPALAGLTARDTGDPAIALLDGWAIAADILAFYTERLANEGYLRTAALDQSLQLLGRLVGYQPRPGLAAGTFLSYTLDKDPSGRDTTVTIPGGARAQSVPAPGQVAQSFETSADLLARWSWNDLQVRMRQPVQIAATQLPHLNEVSLSGTALNLTPGGRLLFIFGTEPTLQALWTVSQVRIDRTAGVTVTGQRAAPPPTLNEIRAVYRELFSDPLIGLESRAARSRIIGRFVTEAMRPLLETIDTFSTPDDLAGALDRLLQRLDEATALAAPYRSVHDWFTDTLRPALAAILPQLAQLQPQSDRAQPPAPLFTALALERGDQAVDPALLAIGAVLSSLRRPPSRPPVSPTALTRDPARIFAPGSDTGPRLLTALDPGISGTLYQALGSADITQPQAVQQVQALRVTASPFGATAPLQPVLDAQGKITGHTEWSLAGNQVLGLHVQYVPGGTQSQQAVLSFSSTAGSWSTPVDLSSATTIDLDLGPGHVHITITPPVPVIGIAAPAAAAPPPPGVVFTFTGNLPNRTVSMPDPATGTGQITVTVQNGGTPLSLTLSQGGSQTGAQGGLQVIARRATAGATVASVDVSVQTPASRALNVLTLDAAYDGIAPGSWVTIDRPRKGADSTDGIPGDADLARVFSRVQDARMVSAAAFGITGKVTMLTLENPWLDDQDTLLSDIRDATVYAGGEPLQLGTEPITDDVGGDQIELAQAYDGLTPGRWVVVTGERTDIPGTTGVQGTELSMVAAVRQTVDPNRPGDTVHAVLVLAVPLGFTYKRATVHVYANVVPATQGASRDEAIGSGDASQAGQTFSLHQSPLTWLAAANNELGAASTLVVRVNGVLWQEADSFAGRGPHEQVYVTSTGTDGRVRVTFGDGVHGARLPTGQENVTAHYRFGIGSPGNVAAGQITQLTSRPLGVNAVTNPLPATGGADQDDATQMRSGIPLALTALDRLVGVSDYADFARSRAGIGRASAARLYDGSRQIVHVTVAGAGDIPLTGDSTLITDLLASLSAFGDPQLPVAVAIRQEVLLLIAASVRVDAVHSWDLVEPQVRAALAARFGFAARDLARPAYLSEVISVIQGVPGVDYVDVTAFGGLSDSTTPADLQNLAPSLDEVVPARPAHFDVTRYTVQNAAGETLTAVAAANGITVAELLSLNPDITDMAPLDANRSVVVFSGIRPAQLVVLSPAVPETLILTEATS
jgi:predicted phage baseplate assembly protein